MSRAANRVGGWTLPELVVVIAVLAIVAAVAAPRGFDADALRLRAYAVEVAGAARLARGLAQGSGCAVELTVDSSGYAARQAAIVGTHCAPSGFPRTLTRVDGGNVQGTAPVNAPTIGTTRWVFNTNGSVGVTGAATLSFGTSSVAVDAATGFVSGP